ncbi:MAG: 5-formyltetrahydrofolate cyclo-ligase [Capnocytophaga sp.]|nr:5-formyltetrahydrofolate cyclo-ligase [Capnocytophaga sp.]
MLKKDLRQLYQQKRTLLTEEEQEKKSLSIANQVLKLPIWDEKNYHLFLPIKKFKEVDTFLFINILWGKNKNIILSRTDFQRDRLLHFLFTEETIIKKNKWDIPEPLDGQEISPKEIDVVFIPLLAFDNQGNRVGYGKGFYDKFLSECKENVTKVGLSFFPPEEKITDIVPTDIPLQYCATPDKNYFF